MDAQQLNLAIGRMLNDASVSVQRLPQCPEIALWLVEPQAMRRRFSEEEMRRIQEYPAYWAFCWASGQVLAREILMHPERVAGKKVMDFGAGSGVVAIACALAGAKEVIACDIDPDALLACAANARLNKVRLRLHGDLFEFDEELDMLIAADVLYDKENLPLLNTFCWKAKEVLVADSRIKNFDFPPYQAEACVESCTVPDLDEMDEFRFVNLYRA
ncbi:MAG: hypothetical protein RL217_1266 [Pseudomonadota bacterium]|jgi:predicted nicotinamide N-methyase